MKKATALKLKHAEQRISQRDHFYPGEVPDIAVHIGDDFAVLAHPVDLSVSGIGLCHPDFHAELVGREVALSCPGSTGQVMEGVVKSFAKVRFGGRTQSRISVVFSYPKPRLVERKERYRCPSGFPAAAHGEHPYHFNHKMLFSVVEFSSSGLALWSSSIRNVVFPGTTVRLSVSLPSQGEYDVDVEITNIRTDPEGNGIIMGGRFVRTPKSFSSAVAAYLLLSEEPGLSVSRLRDNAFKVRDLGAALTFGQVKTLEEWEGVLRLRLETAQAAGRWIGETDPYKLEDEYDHNSRQIICKVNGRIVGAGRLVFNDGDMTRCEHSRHLIIPRDVAALDFVECSRVWVSASFQKSSLVRIITAHMGRIALQTGHRYGLLNCEDSLVPMYRMMGSRELGITFHTEYMQDKRLNLQLADWQALVHGCGVGFRSWVLNWRDVHRHLARNGTLQPTFRQRLRVTLYELLYKVWRRFRCA